MFRNFHSMISIFNLTQKTNGSHCSAKEPGDNYLNYLCRILKYDINKIYMILKYDIKIRYVCCFLIAISSEFSLAFALQVHHHLKDVGDKMNHFFINLKMAISKQHFYRIAWMCFWIQKSRVHTLEITFSPSLLKQ